MDWRQVVEMRGFREKIMKLAAEPGANIRQLCRDYQISRKTYYKWRKRYEREGLEGLENRRRGPQQAAGKSAVKVEQAVLEVRREHPQWGARKIQSVLSREGEAPARAQCTRS